MRRCLRVRSALVLLSASLAILAAGCSGDSESVTVLTSPPPTATSPISGAAQLRSALSADDKLARRDATLDAIEAYLNDDNVVAMDDERASQDLTDLAFSTGRLVIDDRAFVRRSSEAQRLTVVGLPDAMGIALYDLRDGLGNTQPLLLSQWTAGLQSLFVTWSEDEIGVNYVTFGNDGRSRAHFVLAQRNETDGEHQGWRVAWFSDEMRDWWVSALEGELEVASNLSHLTLLGQSDGTTLAFDEGDGVHRAFRTTWQKEGDQYILSPGPNNFDSMQEWLWDIAQPSPYATLVEFLERIRQEDEGGASKLATSSIHGLTAAALDLDSARRRYVVLEQTENQIIFGDDAGSYQFTFRPPDRDGDKWLVVDILSHQSDAEIVGDTLP